MKEFRSTVEIKKELKKVYKLDAQYQSIRLEGGDYPNVGDSEKHFEVIKKIVRLEDELKYAKAYENQLNLKVGDGVTCRMWSDAEAFTVIKRTAKTITIQRDEAILDKDFKPEIVPGGFLGHCVNQYDQKYTYKRNPNGKTYTCRWSDKLGGFKNPLGYGCVSIGRHEFYDYNF